MDRQPSRPLSVAQAKQRVRDAEAALLPATLGRRHPGAAAALALGIAFLCARSPAARRFFSRLGLKFF